MDEAWSLWLAQGSLSSLPGMVRADVHPPLFYLLLFAWTRLAGFSELALRLPSALSGVAAVWGVFALGRRWAGLQTGFVAGVLVAVSPFHLYFAQEARSYALLALLATLATGAWLRLLGDDRRRTRLAYVVWVWLLLYTHYFGLLVVVAHGASYLLLRLGRGGTALRAGWRPFLEVELVAGVGFLPGACLLLEQLVGLPEDFWIPPPKLGSLLDLGRLLVGFGAPPVPALEGWGLLLVTTGAALAALTLLGMTRAGGALLGLRPEGLDRPGPLPARWLTVAATWLGVPVLAAWGLSWVGVEVFTTRNLIVVAPAWALLVSVAVLRIPAQLPRTLALAALIGAPAASLVAYYGTVKKEGWRDAGAFVRALARQDDAFVVDEWFVEPALEYYLGREVETVEPSRGEVTERRRVWLVRSHSRDVSGARAASPRASRLRGGADAALSGDRGEPLRAAGQGGVASSAGPAGLRPTTTSRSSRRGLTKRRSHGSSQR